MEEKTVPALFVQSFYCQTPPWSKGEGELFFFCWGYQLFLRRTKWETQFITVQYFCKQSSLALSIPFPVHASSSPLGDPWNNKQSLSIFNLTHELAATYIFHSQDLSSSSLSSRDMNNILSKEIQDQVIRVENKGLLPPGGVRGIGEVMEEARKVWSFSKRREGKCFPPLILRSLWTPASTLGWMVDAIVHLTRDQNSKPECLKRTKAAYKHQYTYKKLKARCLPPLGKKHVFREKHHLPIPGLNHKKDTQQDTGWRLGWTA